MFIFLRIGFLIPVFNDPEISINKAQLMTVITEEGLVRYANLKKKRLIAEIYKYHFDDQLVDLFDFTIIIQEIAIRSINDPILRVDLYDSDAVFHFKNLNIQVTFKFRIEQKKFPFTHGDGDGIVKILESIAQTNVQANLQNSQLNVSFNNFDYNPTNFKIELTGAAIYGAVIDALHDLFKSIISDMFNTICPEIFSDIVQQDMNSIPTVYHFNNQYVQDQRVIDYYSTRQFKFFVVFMPGYKCYHNLSNNSCLNSYLDENIQIAQLTPTLVNAEVQYIIGQEIINSQYSLVKNITISETAQIINQIDIQFVNMGILVKLNINENNKNHSLELLTKFNITLELADNDLDQLFELGIDFDNAEVIENTGKYTVDQIKAFASFLYKYLQEQRLNVVYGQVNDVNMSTCNQIYQNNYMQIYCRFNRPNDV